MNRAVLILATIVLVFAPAGSASLNTISGSQLAELESKMQLIQKGIDEQSARKLEIVTVLQTFLNGVAPYNFLQSNGSGQQLNDIRSSLTTLTVDLQDTGYIHQQLFNLELALHDIATPTPSQVEFIANIETTEAIAAEVAATAEVVEDIFEQLKELRGPVRKLPEQLTEKQRCKKGTKAPEPKDCVAIEVFLDVFSCAQNPTWEIVPNDPSFLELATAIFKEDSSSLGTALGYMGMSLHCFTKKGLQITMTMSTYDDVNRQLLVLETAPGNISPELIQFVRNAVMKETDSVPRSPPTTELPLDTADSVGAELQCTCPWPSFKPQRWNTSPKVYRNSCYNYATNVNQESNAQPGRGGCLNKTELTTEVSTAYVIAALEKDGLVDLRSDVSSASLSEFSNGCLLALLTLGDLDLDFLLLRLDETDTWSYKRGAGPITDKDNSGKKILDPRHGDFGPYEFVSFLAYCPDAITIG